MTEMVKKEGININDPFFLDKQIQELEKSFLKKKRL
jgi:hypothetical protein